MTAVVELRAGTPARVLAAAAPVLAVALLGWRAAADGFARTPDDPVAPWVLVGPTLLGAAWVSWRALTQAARLDEGGLRCRNLSVTVGADWSDVERLEVVRRWGLLVIEVRFRGHRRRHRLGAATRFAARDAEAVLDLLRAHPVAAGLLADAGP
jgi:hypothetical protein